ncbi:MAG TPA: LysR substrate-binding domain-containing protein, partial [Azonexus sp.]|nr:LysR substrate-binding domain-containing protein [Azonexus sp.]
VAVGLGWTLMPRRVVEQSPHAGDLVVETVPDDIGRVPTGMISLREAPPMGALKTLAEAISAAARRAG